MKEIFQHPLKAKFQRKLHTSPDPEFFLMLEEMRDRKITGRATQGANNIGTEH
jgi:hypothetical protein